MTEKIEVPPEPPDGTIIEFDHATDLYAVYRDDKSSREAGWTVGDGGEVWCLYGDSVPMTWVALHQEFPGMKILRELIYRKDDHRTMRSDSRPDPKPDPNGLSRTAMLVGGTGIGWCAAGALLLSFVDDDHGWWPPALYVVGAVALILMFHVMASREIRRITGENVVGRYRPSLWDRVSFQSRERRRKKTRRQKNASPIAAHRASYVTDLVGRRACVCGEPWSEALERCYGQIRTMKSGDETVTEAITEEKQ